MGHRAPAEQWSPHLSTELGELKINWTKSLLPLINRYSLDRKLTVAISSKVSR